MNKKIIIVSIAIILTISFILIQFQFTGRTIQEEENYIHTKAICNESNFCQDYEITCEGNKTTNTKPLTGAVIQHPEDWQDPRENPEKLCN